jgi:hypothetical protein
LSTAYIQVAPRLRFFQIITRANSLTSALNTNVLIEIHYMGSPFKLIETHTIYIDKYNYADSTFTKFCQYIDPATVTPAGFYSVPFNETSFNHIYWPINPPHFRPTAISTVHGFFGGCTALDAVLNSTFDCLYDMRCLETFTNYFPNLTQVCMSLTLYIF